jgi:hypothetical protein
VLGAGLRLQPAVGDAEVGFLQQGGMNVSNYLSWCRLDMPLWGTDAGP